MNRYGYGSTTAVVIFAMIFMLKTCVRHQQNASREAVNYSFRAEEAYDKGDLKMALHYTNQAIQMDPNEPELYANRALINDQLGNTADALADVEKAAQLNGKDPTIRLMQASMYTDNNRDAEALEVLTAGLAHDPESAELLFMRAMLLMNSGQMNDALNDINQMIQIGREPALAILAQGYHAYYSANFPSALQIINSSLEGSQEFEDMMLELRSGIHFHMGNYPAAIADSERAYSLDPDSGFAKAIQGKAHLLTGNTDSASQSFQASTRSRTYRDNGFAGLALMAMANGNLAEAETHAIKAIEVNDDDFDHYQSRAVVEILKGQAQPALQNLDKALTVASANKGIYDITNRLSAASISNHRIEDVMIRQYGVSFFRMHYDRGLVLLMLGDAAGARAEFEKAREEFPKVAVSPTIEQIIAAFDSGQTVSIARQGWKYQVVIGQ